MEMQVIPQKRIFNKPKTTSMLDGLGKMPPQALDLEEAVLGALLIDKDALSKVSDFLRVEAFYSDKHQFIYKAILSLFVKSEPVDLRTVVNELRLSGKLEIVGGPFYVSELTIKILSSVNVEFHARLLVQYALKRTLISVSSEIQTNAFDDTKDVFHILDHAQQQLFEVSEQMQKKNFIASEGLVALALKEIEERKNKGEGLTGVPSGFVALDRLTSGWQKSDLVIIAARPAMGKTAFVLSTARNAAVEHGHSVAIFSLEMSNVQLMLRLISSEAEIESEKIKKGRLADHEWIQLSKKAGNLAKAKIFIDDTPALSVLELRSKCRKLKSLHGVELIIIDYMQLMSGDTGSKTSNGNREQEIAYISRSLKGLAKELNVPVIALSQLSRATESRGGDKIPQLSDLRESGSIEQDADMVMFIHRPEYYGITEDGDGLPVAGVGNIIVAKHRNGPTDTVKLRYIGKFTKFCDFEDGNGFEVPSSDFSSGFPDIKGQGFGQNEVRMPSKNWDNTDKNNGIDLGKASDYNEPPPF